jgi:hypothetical protein
MPPSLDEVCARLDAAIRAQNEAESIPETILALLALDASAGDLLIAQLVSQETLPLPLQERSARGEEIPTAELHQAALAAGWLDTTQVTSLQALHQRAQVVVRSPAALTPDEILRGTHDDAESVAALIPVLCQGPVPPVHWPIYQAQAEPPPADVVQLQQELQRTRQRTIELEQNTQRLSRALAAANNEVDRLRSVVNQPARAAAAQPAWQHGARLVLWGLLLVILGLGAYFLARAALNLPWPWLFVSFLILVAVPLGLYFGVVYIARGSRHLSVDRLIGYAAILLVVAVLVFALFDRSGGTYAQRIGSVTSRWAAGALLSPVTLVRAVLAAPQPFLAALRGRSPATTEPDATPTVAVAIDVATATPTSAPLPTATITPTLAPTVVVTATLVPTSTATIQVGGQVRVTGTQFLNARRGPGLNFQLVTRFDENAILTVLQGPVQANNYQWWEVRNDQGQGWCADEWLQAVP